MRALLLLTLLLGAAAPAAAQRASLGIFAGWGAFEERGQRRCYAIAEPERRGGGRPFASVGYWPGKGAAGQLHVRLSRAKREGSAVLLRIGERTWQLGGTGLDAWAADARADAEIVAAMRSGIAMSVETRSAGGAAVRDRYALRGAASAIDAAAVACASR